MTAASKFSWCEKGSWADNGGFVSAKMTARKRSFFTILFDNARTTPMAFVPASAKRKGAFGLATCRLDSCTALVGFNFRPKQKEWALLCLFREWSTPSEVWHLFVKKTVRLSCVAGVRQQMVAQQMSENFPLNQRNFQLKSCSLGPDEQAVLHYDEQAVWSRT